MAQKNKENGKLLSKEEAAEIIFFTLCDLQHPEERPETVKIALNMFFDQEQNSLSESAHPARSADKLVANLVDKS